MQKLSRLIAIEKIISNEDISSQEELMEKLVSQGIKCTQATLSRNLRQLGVIKVPDGKGGYRYSLVKGLINGMKESNNKEKGFELVSVIKNIIEAKSMILIKTSPGYANSVAVTIDNAGRYEIAGTVAGDDTLLVIPRDNVSVEHVHEILDIIFPGINSISGKI
ncbi:MAG TPA: arginine repressor [Bacteroidales bacterium]|nr:arginine repressor [Bacteroidales bacterium]HCI56056.1 arginine repressor [Bacteroidales bacterium]HOU96253.1 arginine repressor [Bacteroidales bacterium]HQG53068.1 arginine repressor [Bacteroidales bacterium]HRC88646.1 arginine repressor [Bacteroidales bacterium]